MNKKGFTLIELIAVVTIIAIIAVIATPNVIGMIDRSKREKFVLDGEEMISTAKYRFKLAKYQTDFTTDEGNTTCKTITAAKLSFNTNEDPDGNTYNKNLSGVKVCLENGTYIYYVKTISTPKNENSTPRGIYSSSNSGNYVMEAQLNIASVSQLSN